MQKITIACTWDGGDYYPIEYVNKLYNMVKRNTTIPFDFLLYAGPLAAEPGRLNKLNPEIRVVWSGLKYWWGGMRVFEKEPMGVETGKILMLDLDIVIIGNIDEIINMESESDLICMKDYPKDFCPCGNERDVNVSVTLLRTGAHPEIWDRYVAEGMPEWNVVTKKGDRPLPLGSQTIINDLKIAELFDDRLICSYKLHQVHKFGLPAGCKVVVFHGRPKPHEVNDEFVKENWQ